MLIKKPWEVFLDEAGGASDGGGGTPNIADGGGDAGGGGGAEPPPGGDAGKSWLETLGDLGKDPSLQTFKDPASLAKSWVNAQKMIGANKVVIPGEGATEEEVAAFYNKLGRPEAADKYEIKLAEGREMDKNFADGFKGAAHRLGLNQKQVQALAEWYDSAAQEAMKGAADAGDAQLRGALAEYEKSLGGADKFKERLDAAKGAVRALTDEAFRKYLNDSGMGSRPEVIEHFAKLAAMLKEDKIRDGTGVPFSNQDPASIKKEIEDLETKMFTDLNSPNMASWVERRNALYERLGSARTGA